VSGGTQRVDWVDYAKGWCIILVVMMHSTLGVEEAMGRETWLHGFISWARPFRMPDFFLVAGLFLSQTIDRPWRDYVDRKVLHFAYFLVLWTAIQGFPKWLIAGDDPGSLLGHFAFAMIEPFGTLWFIYLLPIFFVATKLLRRAPPLAVLLAGAALQIAQIHTGSTVIDEFAGRYIYFYAGYLFAPAVFRLAEKARQNRVAAGAALLAWGTVNGLAVSAGYAALPGVSLVLGFAGAGAVVSFSALLAETQWMPFLRAPHERRPRLQGERPCRSGSLHAASPTPVSPARSPPRCRSRPPSRRRRRRRPRRSGSPTTPPRRP
jgi:uncharacterized membrane protein YcfT